MLNNVYKHAMLALQSAQPFRSSSYSLLNFWNQPLNTILETKSHPVSDFVHMKIPNTISLIHQKKINISYITNLVET